MTQFRAGLEIDNTQAVQSLSEVGQKADDTKQAVTQLGDQGSSALESLGDAAGTAHTGLGRLHDIGERMKGLQLQQTFGAIRGALGDIGDVLGTPLDQGTVGRMLQLGSSFAEVGAMAGPQGALVGAIIGAAIPAFTSLVTWVQSATDEMYALEAANRITARSYDDLLTNIRSVASAQRQQQRLAGGFGSLEEQQANLASEQSEVDAIEGRIAELDRQLSGGVSARESQTLDAAITVLRREMARAARERDIARDALAAAEGDAAGDTEELAENLARSAKEAGQRETESLRGTRSGGGRAAATSSALRGGPALGSDPFAEGIESLLAPLGGEETMVDILSQLSTGFDELTASAVESGNAFDELGNVAKSAAETFSESWRGGVDEVIAAFDEANDAAKAAGRTQIAQGRLMETAARSVGNTVLESIGEDVAAGFAASIAAVVSGTSSFEEAMGKMLTSLLNNVLQQAIVKTIFEIAEGVSAAASVVRAAEAPGHFAAAGAWAAVAVAAGAGLAVASSMGGGGGGSSSAAPSASSNARPAEDNEREREPKVYNINYNNPLFENRNDQIRFFRQLDRESRR